LPETLSKEAHASSPLPCFFLIDGLHMSPSQALVDPGAQENG